MKEFRNSLLRIFLKTCILASLVIIIYFIGNEITTWRANVKYKKETKRIEKEYKQESIIIRGVDTVKKDTINELDY
jgi:hypothetical protein